VGAWCVNAKCFFGCTADSDCHGTNESCQAGLCKTRIPGTCSTSAHCQAGQDCVNGNCASQCSNAGQCTGGNVCRIGYCLPPSTTVCTTNCDCPTSQRCVMGSCQP